MGEAYNCVVSICLKKNKRNYKTRWSNFSRSKQRKQKTNETIMDMFSNVAFFVQRTWRSVIGSEVESTPTIVAPEVDSTTSSDVPPTEAVPGVAEREVDSKEEVLSALSTMEPEIEEIEETVPTAADDAADDKEPTVLEEKEEEEL